MSNVIKFDGVGWNIFGQGKSTDENIDIAVGYLKKIFGLNDDESLDAEYILECCMVHDDPEDEEHCYLDVVKFLDIVASEVIESLKERVMQNGMNIIEVTMIDGRPAFREVNKKNDSKADLQ